MSIDDGPKVVQIHSIRVRQRMIIVEADRYVFMFVYEPRIPMAQQRWRTVSSEVLGQRDPRIDHDDRVAKTAARAGRELVRQVVSAWLAEHPTERLEELNNVEIWLHPSYPRIHPEAAERHRAAIGDLVTDLSRKLSLPQDPPPI